MRPYYSIPLVVALGLSVGLIRSPEPIAACGMAVPLNGHVAVSDESAVIVWDSQAKVEHFVRTASFSSTSAEFGFLVPTPTQPDLGEVLPATFPHLERITAPRVEYRTQKISGSRNSMNKGTTAPAPAGGGARNVQVLEQKRVGNFDAAVLKASDESTLQKWLSDNGYDARPELASWLKIYTELNWIITAFKIATGLKNSPGNSVAIRSTAVRMSFPTERPFYPYREPVERQSGSADATNRSRLLRVYFLADARYDGKLGETGPAWHGSVVVSKSLDKANASESIANLKLNAPVNHVLQDRAWRLTEFEDHSSPRPGTDEVYFAYSANQNEVERPPQIVYVDVYDDSPSGDEARIPAVVYQRIVLVVLFVIVLGALCFWLVRQTSTKR